jgi:hypothetical protein
MKLDSMLGELTQLRDDLRSCRVAQKVAAYGGIRRVNRHVQWRQPVLDNSTYVRRLEVGQGRKVSIPEGQAIIIITDVQDLPQPVR